MPWTRKYQPTGTSQLLGQDTALTALKAHISTFSTSKIKAALIYGPPGSGKTASVYALAAELNLEVVDINASDTRNKGSLEELLGPAMLQRSLFSQGKLILIDEIDGLSGKKDRGGVAALTKLIGKSAFPVILTANDPWERKFSTLRRKCALIKFNTPQYRTIAKVLTGIAEKEGIKAEPELVDKLSRRAGGDIRAAICDLQMLTAGTDTLTSEALEELDARDQQDTIMNALVRVFKSTDPIVAWEAFKQVDMNPEECFPWVHENLMAEYTKPLDLYRGYEALSRADIHRGRIRRWQYYRFWDYLRASITMGVALAKDEKYKTFIKYKQPRRGLEIWQAKRANALRDSIVERLAEHTHTPIRVARSDMLPYIRAMFTNKTTTSPVANAVAETLDLSPEELAWLRKI